MSVKPEVKPLDPSKPMLETLEAYCLNSDVKLTVKQVKTKLGSHTSKYYQICQLMTKMFLFGKPDKKRRGLVLTGAPNSGKSTISRFAGKIFSSHDLM